MSGPAEEAREGSSEGRALRQRLGRAGYRPSRRLGQNLLLDANLAAAIARDSGAGPGDFVLEVGPGAGALTVPLLEAGCRVLAVEIDERLLAEAQAAAAAAGAPGEAEFVLADVLARKSALAPEVEARLPAEGPWQLVSNLPYSIAGPLLAVLSRRANPPRAMTVLVQREVAERLAAAPGTAAWGALPARLQVLYDVRRLRPVPGEVFWPRPQVESGLVRLELREPRPDPGELARFDALVERLFERRRQTLARVLGALLGDRAEAAAALGALGIDGGRRAETLTLAELGALAGQVAPPRRGGGTGRP